VCNVNKKYSEYFSGLQTIDKSMLILIKGLLFFDLWKTAVDYPKRRKQVLSPFYEKKGF